MICNPGAVSSSNPTFMSGSLVGNDTDVATGVIDGTDFRGPDTVSDTPEINIPIKIPTIRLIVLCLILFFIFAVNIVLILDYIKSDLL